MNLTGLHIEGFGLFKGLSIKGLSPGMTVFLGRNEAGKSTLLGFFRAVFFGFPDGRSRDNAYPPLNGGRHGGQITLLDGHGEPYIVERFSGPKGGPLTVIKPDQTRGDTACLEKLLGKANSTLFKNIYAFSLSELQDFKSLNTQEVSEALYSAGAGIDPKQLLRMKSDLEKRETDLFKPGGSKPTLNRNLSRLMEIMKQRKGLAGSVDEFDRIRMQTARIAEEAGRAEKEREAISEELRKAERWLRIRPDWVTFSHAQKRMKALTPIPHFPARGISRLEGLKTRIDDLRETLWEREAVLGSQEREYAELSADDRLLDQSEALLELQRGQGHFEAVAGEILSLEQDIQGVEERLKEELKRLGPEWNETRILEFDLSIGSGEEVRRYRDDLQKARAEEQRKRDLLEDSLSKEREGQAVMDHLPEPPEKNPDILGGKVRSCQTLRRLDFRGQVLKKELEQIGERIVDLREGEAIMRQVLKAPDHGGLRWLYAAMMAVGVLLLTWFGSRQAWLTALTAGGALFLAGALLLTLSLRGRKKDEDAGGEGKGGFRGIEDKIKDLATRETNLQEEFDGLQEQIDLEKTALSLSGPLSMKDLDRMEQSLTEQGKQLEQWAEKSRALERMKERSEEIRGELHAAESKREKLETSWRAWLESRGLAAVLSPEGALETFALIHSLKEHSAHLGQLRNRRVNLEETRSAFITLVRGVLEKIGRDPCPDGEIPIAVHALIQDFKSAEESKQKRALLEGEIENSRRTLERLKGQIEKVEQDLRELMASGGAETEEAFRERGQIYDERIALQREMERSRENIVRFSESSGEGDEVMAQLPGIRFEDLEKRKIGLEKDLGACHEAIDRFKKEEATLEERVRQLTNDERISTLRAEEEGLKESLGLMAEEWAVLRLARGLIRTAGARYERERQPGVIQEAGRYLKTLTGGEYPAIVAPMGENRLELVTRDNRRKEIGELSRGTAEQLYLSLRFGFIREFSKRSETLPIIMDETLVNFDPVRARAAAEAILELSEEHQILFFTCHPGTAGLFRDVDPGVRVLELGGGKADEWKGPD